TYTLSSRGDSISQDGNKNLGDLRLGSENEFNKDWFISADLSGRFGSNSYSSFQGMLSLEYLF
uniref:autotransporter outer membrane beta-barrel domain-containing protein n=1 Tax=Phascolarctobacterium faecium TaxID=33025 RepID=UPI003A8D02DE